MKDYGLHAFSEEELGDYKTHGYLVRREVFTNTECEQLCFASGAVEAQALDIADESGDGSAVTNYCLDGNRFVDIDHITVQYEHECDAERLRVI